MATTPTQRALVITTGATHGTIKHGGMERTYRLYVPTSATAASSMALVVGLHGGFGWGDQFAARDLISGATYVWGQHPYVRLDPHVQVAHVIHVRAGAV
mgnify:CR=1 FL=1